MVRHVVMWKFDDTLTEVTKNKYADIITETIFDLNKKVDEIKNVEVQRNGLKSDETNYDIIMYADFDSYDALYTYQHHPEYQKAVAVVRPRTGKRAAIDYEL